MNSQYPAARGASARTPACPARGGALRLMSAFVASALLGVLFFAADTARADPPGVIHYPDLWPYYGYGLRSDLVNGRRLLSFNAAIANLGQGPIELFPVNNTSTGTTDAYQRIFSHDAAGNWYVVETRYVGTFEFHPAHNHWHFDNFASYQLRDMAPDGSVGPNVLASSMKVSFCLRDDWQANANLEHSMPQTYVQCEQNAVQGIAVGWADIYAWSLEGQNLDITNIRDGTYWLLITVDSGNVLTEGGGGKSNNTNGTKFRLSDHGKRIQIIRYGF